MFKIEKKYEIVFINDQKNLRKRFSKVTGLRVNVYKNSRISSRRWCCNKFLRIKTAPLLLRRRDGRAVECGGLENR